MNVLFTLFSSFRKKREHPIKNYLESIRDFAFIDLDEMLKEQKQSLEKLLLHCVEHDPVYLELAEPLYHERKQPYWDPSSFIKKIPKQRKKTTINLTTNHPLDEAIRWRFLEAHGLQFGDGCIELIPYSIKTMPKGERRRWFKREKMVNHRLLLNAADVSTEQLLIKIKRLVQQKIKPMEYKVYDEYKLVESLQ